MREGKSRATERALSERTDLADCVIDLACRKQDTEDMLEEGALRDELTQFLVAGQETTATALAWGMKYLARNVSAP